MLKSNQKTLNGLFWETCYNPSNHEKARPHPPKLKLNPFNPPPFLKNKYKNKNQLDPGKKSFPSRWSIFPKDYIQFL